jgi:hypothetical protein
MQPLRVKDLLAACQREVANGNGNKIVLLSADEEGNYFNEMFYAFTPSDEFEESDLNTRYCKSDVIILG